MRPSSGIAVIAVVACLVLLGMVLGFVIFLPEQVVLLNNLVWPVVIIAIVLGALQYYLERRK